ncbi:uncharacterized protein LOC122710281 isoform X10 [Cervus elaphus]|uniref:uncharacterized protein LOC122710281 isoform X10 n=1 Tax=Cervus elaphus TaxID=9860 RepID=UPI001CC324FD|nr:uncharacterized protein LOC122710281 isoform X10 [Cervus elaphus]
MDPGRRHPGTCGVVEDTDWPGPGHVTIRSRARVSCSWWVSGGDSSSTPHWSPDQREGSCQGSPGVCDPQRCSSRCGKPRQATLCPSTGTTGEPTTGRTDRDFVNDVSEKEQRWGACLGCLSDGFVRLPSLPSQVSTNCGRMCFKNTRPSGRKRWKWDPKPRTATEGSLAWSRTGWTSSDFLVMKSHAGGSFGHAAASMLPC